MAARAGRRARPDAAGRGRGAGALVVAHRVRVPAGLGVRLPRPHDERALDRLKSDFVSTVSHELRTPLAAIYGAAMTLRRVDVPLDDEQRESMLNVVASESERLARIVNDILYASRLDSDAIDMAIARIDALEVAGLVVAAARAHLPQGVELVVRAPDGLPSVAADPDKVRQVLVNLVENAIKYFTRVGLVEIGLEAFPDRPRFSSATTASASRPRSSSGSSRKFYRVDPNLTRGVGGMGLGLYISREIVHRMDGRSGSTRRRARARPSSSC